MALLIVERMMFVNLLVRHLLVCCVCTMSLAASMTALDVFEVKQTIEDGVDYHRSAVRTFRHHLSEEKASLHLRPIQISDGYLQVLNDLHIQKSSNSNVDTNDKLYDCYRQLQSMSTAELEAIDWHHDIEVFDVLQQFIVDQIQKRHMSESTRDFKYSKDAHRLEERKSTAEFWRAKSIEYEADGQIKKEVENESSGIDDKSMKLREKSNSQLDIPKQEKLEIKSDTTDKKESARLSAQKLQPMISADKTTPISNPWNDLNQISSQVSLRKNSGGSPSHKTLPKLPPVPVSDFKLEQEVSLGNPAIADKKPPIPVRKKKKRKHHFAAVE